MVEKFISIIKINFLQHYKDNHSTQLIMAHNIFYVSIEIFCIHAQFPQNRIERSFKLPKVTFNSKHVMTLSLLVSKAFGRNFYSIFLAKHFNVRLYFFNTFSALFI